MIKLKDILGSNLNELFDTSAKDITWDTSDPDSVTGEFTVSNGNEYELSIVAPYMAPDEIDVSEFFDDKVPEEFEDKSRFVEFKLMTGAKPTSYLDSGGKSGIEGTGAAAEVFGIVINGLLWYIKKYKPSAIYFQAVEPSRIRLYTVITKRMLQSLSGWKTKIDGGHFIIYNSRLLRNK